MSSHRRIFDQIIQTNFFDFIKLKGAKINCKNLDVIECSQRVLVWYNRSMFCGKPLKLLRAEIETI